MAASTTNDSTMVSLGKFKVGGYAYWAPSGTALPTDSSAPLAAAFKLLGYLSEDGLTNATDTDTTEIKDANGTTVMRSSPATPSPTSSRCWRCCAPRPPRCATTRARSPARTRA